MEAVVEQIGYDGQIYCHEAAADNVFDFTYYGIHLVRDYAKRVTVS